MIHVTCKLDIYEDPTKILSLEGQQRKQNNHFISAVCAT